LGKLIVFHKKQSANETYVKILAAGLIFLQFIFREKSFARETETPQYGYSNGIGLRLTLEKKDRRKRIGYRIEDVVIF
jgi:hypothetical protein